MEKIRVPDREGVESPSASLFDIVFYDDVSVDAAIREYRDFLDGYLRGFVKVTVPGLKEDLYDAEKECRAYLKEHTELALKVALTEIMFEMRLHYSDTDRLYSPIFLVGDATFSYPRLKYLGQLYQVYKFTEDDTGSAETVFRTMAQIDQAQGGTADVRFFRNKTNREALAGYYEGSPQKTDVPSVKTMDDLCAAERERYLSFNSAYGDDEEEDEERNLVEFARQFNIMPWEVLPLKDEYRNKPVAEWDIKPICPVTGYDPEIYDLPDRNFFERHNFWSYGFRDVDLLKEDGFDYMKYPVPDDPYTAKLLEALKMGRQQLGIQWDRDEDLIKIRQESGAAYQEALSEDLAAGFTEEEFKRDLDPDRDLGVYLCSLSEDEFRRYCFQHSRACSDVWTMVHWNRDHVFPKVVKDWSY